MTQPNSIPTELAAGPFRRADGLRLVSADDLRGPSYRRMLHGVYALAGQGTYADRIRAALAVLPEGAVLAGTSALWSWGVRLADATTPVEVIVPRDSRARGRPEVRLRRDRLSPDEVIPRPLGPTTSPARTAFDVARSGPPLQTVPLLDALVRQTVLRADAVQAVAAAYPRARWSSRVEPALALVDPAAESVRESELRVLLVQAGLPRPVTQHVVRTAAGRFVARTDLAWPRWRVACEYDGAHHDERAQVVRDRARLNAMRRAGWTVVVVDAAQFARREEMLGMIRSVLVAAGW